MFSAISSILNASSSVPFDSYIPQTFPDPLMSARSSVSVVEMENEDDEEEDEEEQGKGGTSTRANANANAHANTRANLDASRFTVS
jgi:hypothetical protein